MTSAADGAGERARHLLAIAAGLGEATTPEQVADAIFREALAAVGADAGSLALVHGLDEGHGPDGVSNRGGEGATPGVVAPAPTFEIVRIRGFEAPVVERYRRFPLRPGRPLSDAVLAHAPVLLADRAAWRAAYPEVDAETDGLGYEGFAAVPVASGGQVLAGLTFSFRAPVAFDEATRTFLATLGEQCGLALARARAFEAERRARERSTFLAEASRLLASSLDYAVTLRTVAEAAVPRLGDWCAVDVVRDPTAPTWPPVLDRLAVVHQDPVKVALGAALTVRYPTDWSADTGMAAVLRDGTPLFLPAVLDTMLVAGARDAEHLALLRALGFSAIIVVPLVARARTLGALTLCMSESGRRYTGDDLALAEDLARRAAVAVDNARLYAAERRARAEAEVARGAAESANRAKGEFLSTMSHELRTPLNAIGGYAELLEMGVRGPVTDAQREDLARIRRAGQHLQSLINDVLNYARLEAGRVQYEPRDVRLDEVVADVEAMVAPQVRARGLTFTHDACAPNAPDPLRVRADPEKARQILLNLLTNAIKFTAPGGRVALTCEAITHEVAPGDGADVGEPGEEAHAPQTDRSAAAVRLRVADTGRGIPTDQLARIFEPFVQVERHRTPESQQGVGLGLAISRDLARGMGGDLTAESAPGVGSTFTLTLPAA